MMKRNSSDFKLFEIEIITVLLTFEGKYGIAVIYIYISIPLLSF